MRRSLIVNADDYGRSREVSTGILEAHHHGIVTTTTVLINLPEALPALREGMRQAPGLGFGLHLNLTLGEPCWNSAASTALVGSNGQFHPINLWQETPDLVPASYIRTEWQAQIDKMGLAGIMIDHLDSHHHIATMRSDIWQIYLELAEQLHCGVRPPYPNDISLADMQASFPSAMIETAKNSALPALKATSIPHPDSFLASFYDKTAGLPHLLTMLENLTPGVSEIMCHPGYSSPALAQTSSYAHQRVLELAALTAAETIQMVEDQEIQLVTYRQAWRTR